MERVTLRVPATTANLGPGFDSFGCALTLYNTYTFERLPQGLEITGCPQEFCNRENLAICAYDAVLAALGLPGDLSSSSRFVRAAFTRLHSRSGDSEVESVAQFFHILGAVAQQKGCCEVEPGKYEYTIYTSCANASKGIYYYTTYENPQWNAVDMYRVDLDAKELFCYPLRMQGEVCRQN